jgi:tetratricopeptide (TPR) repeat protein
MSDPRPAEALSGADDDARIEYLLVTGLDHYFAGEYEHAINLWTRVLFLDRNHDRARAYIDRARSAQAEQQRISEALIHEGLEAFDRGEVVRARTLLSDALDQGASNDVALGVLGRIDRLDVGSRAALPAQPDARRRPAARVPAAPDMNQRRSTLTLWWITAATVVLVSAIAFVLMSPNGLAEWFPEQTAASTAAPVAAPPAALPIPSPTEGYLSQARALFASGKLRDALHALDRIPQGDTLHAEAERLRADIQRELLAVAGAEASTALSQAPAVPPRSE